MIQPEFHFTDEQWREYQALPEQGYSHRHWLERQFNSWLPAQFDEFERKIRANERAQEEIRNYRDGDQVEWGYSHELMEGAIYPDGWNRNWFTEREEAVRRQRNDLRWRVPTYLVVRRKAGEWERE